MNYYAAYNKEAAEDFEKGLIVGQYYAYQKTVGKQYKKLMNRLSGAADDLVAQLEARQELDTEIEVGYNRQMDELDKMYAASDYLNGRTKYENVAYAMPIEGMFPLNAKASSESYEKPGFFIEAKPA